GVPLLATALALAALAGHFQIAAYVWLATTVYALARALWAAVTHKPWFPLSLAAGFLLAGLISAGQVLPSIELAVNSPRGMGGPTEEGFAFHRSRALQPDELLMLLRPNLFGNPARGDYQLVRYGVPYAEHCGFVGIITVALALSGIACARTRHYAFFLILAAMALNIAMCGPLARAIYFGIPKLGLAGSFTRMLSVYSFALAMAAAAGLDACCRRIRRSEAPADEPGRSPWNLGAVGTLCALAVVVLLFELVPWARGYLPVTRRENVYPLTPTIERLMQASGRVLVVSPRSGWGLLRTPQALLPPNAATVYGYDSVAGYDSLFPRNYRGFIYRAEKGEPSPAANGNLLLPANASDPLYGVAGLSTVARMPYDEVGRGVLVQAREPLLPRAFVVPDGPRCGDGLAQHLWQTRSWHEVSAVMTEVAGCQMTREGPASILLSGLHSDGPQPWLIVTETFYPGWNAYVDGMLREATSAGGVFCAVPLRAGERQVRLVFEPASVRVGLMGTLLGLAGLAGLMAFGRFGRRAWL
ncbi:MAG: hypothetical protein AB7Y46_14945, partial [Armatimonadota bacterium]